MAGLAFPLKIFQGRAKLPFSDAPEWDLPGRTRSEPPHQIPLGQGLLFSQGLASPLRPLDLNFYSPETGTFQSSGV